MRDMTHKISREIVNVAVDLEADTIVMGDIKDIADGVNFGKKNNQKISGYYSGHTTTICSSLYLISTTYCAMIFT